jgi:hypothetical protein
VTTRGREARGGKREEGEQERRTEMYTKAVHVWVKREELVMPIRFSPTAYTSLYLVKKRRKKRFKY